MPRLLRMISPGDLVHVISRFTNKEFRLVGPDFRAQYLARLGKSLMNNDWRLLSYALMSTHIHLAFIAGSTEFWSLIKPVHSGFANWLNAYQKRLGPVFADRPKTLIVEKPLWPRLIAYQHNNVVRAGIVAQAHASEWTSHRAYLYPLSRPKWLNARLGLELMSLRDNKEGRRNFDELVRKHAEHPREPIISGRTMSEDCRQIRAELGTSITCAYPLVLQDRLIYRVTRQAEPWKGNIEQVLDAICAAKNILKDIVASHIREAQVVAARRLLVLTARLLGFSQDAIGLRLGISRMAVSKLERHVDFKDLKIILQATELAKSLRAQTQQTQY